MHLLIDMREKALPSESTLRRWCSKLDSSPGFNSMALKLLHIKVEEKAKKRQKVFISMAIDEMAIYKSSSHRYFLIKKVVSCYITRRLKHHCKEYRGNVKKIRVRLSKLILLKNQ